MNPVGVDLAGGQRNPTGVAVLDADGRLVHVSQQQTDEQILAALAPYVAGPCVVAFDAPLVVTNPTGNRPAEARLNADFAKYDAGAHPSNTGKKEFRDGTRGGRLAAELGLSLDPWAGERRALEVYPHAANVALFGLGRILRYKNRTGRSLDLLRSELLRLTAYLEGLAHASPPMDVTANETWKALVAAAESAGRKSELRFVEDQVDAVVCAYVALLAGTAPERLTAYGEPATGLIVTPTLSPDQRPGEDAGPPPTAAPDRADVVREAVADFAAGHGDLEAATEEYVTLVRGLLDDAGINYLSVTGRAKSVASFAAKAQRTVDGRPVFPDPLRDIADQIGLRVITYLHRDVAAVAGVLADEFTVLDDRDLGKETASQGRFGYASRHLQIAVPPSGGPDVSDLVRARDAQVQVRTVLQHAWAEFEHATRYKGSIPAADVSELDRRFTLAAGLLEMADREFSAIHERLRATGSDRRVGRTGDAPRLDAEDLANFLTERYAEAGWSRPDHYAWMAGLLLELGITSVDELASLLEAVDAEGITARMGYRYPPGAVRRLDDALLDVYGPRYVGLPGNERRVEALRARLAKLRAEDPPS
jgi:predicted RNase H-like nuclease/ppGpp synthetase/RelA/SpoT-type nucleotidyltranferase